MLGFPSGGMATANIGGWRRLFRTGVWAVLPRAVTAVFIGVAMAQSPIATYGYSRDTLPGIPGGPGVTGQAGGVFPTRYYLFVVVDPGSQVATKWVWIRGRYYDCKLRKVATPVTVDSDPGVPTARKETLVPKTKSDVYAVDPDEATDRSASTDQERALLASNEVVIALVVNKINTYAVVPSIKALRPAAAM
jgi:hypothetical protein